MTTNNLNKSLRSSIAAEAKSVASRQQPAAAPLLPSNTDSKQQKTAAESAARPKKAAVKKPLATPKSVKAQAKAKPANHKKPSQTNTRPDNLATTLAHDKLHHIVETNYHLYETYLENLQRINDNFHDYLNQLVEINNLNSLLKLNLSYLSSAPLRYQEMIAQNKSIFSEFFRFALPSEK